MDNDKYGQTYFWCCGITVDGVRCGAATTGCDRNYGIGSVGVYGDMGGRVCGRHQNILILMICFIFHSFNMFSMYIYYLESIYNISFIVGSSLIS